MEPVKVPIVIFTHVVLVEEGFHTTHTDADGTAHRETLGWFVLFEGSHEKIFLGNEKPDLAAGDRVKITIQKVP